MEGKESWARLFVDGEEAGVVTQVEGRESLSDLFCYDVVVEAPARAAAAPPIGATAALELRSRQGLRTVRGIVAEASARLEGARGTILRLSLRPFAFKATLGRDCLAMQDVTIPDVVKAVLDEAGPIRWSLTASYPVFPYRAQYREDDWTYSRRLLEEAGIYGWFDHDDGSTLVFADRSPAAPPIEPVEILPYRPGAGLETAEVEGITDAGAFQTSTAGRFTMRSFDPLKPRLQVEGTAGTSGPEVYDAPGGGPSDPAYVQRLVELQREATIAGGSGLGGSTNCVRVYPGRWFRLALHPRFDGEWLVTAIQVRVTSSHEPVHTTFQAIPLGVPYRPPRVSPDAKQAGLQMGRVTGAPGMEVHPDPTGRVRVQLHWDRKGGWDDKAGTWMRAQQRCTPGSMLLPRVGWNVATFNEEGGVDAPALLWRIHDGEHKPTYALPANKTRVVYKTATTPGGGSFNEIYFEDKLGAEEMFIHASKDMDVYVQHKKTEMVDNDHTRKVSNVHDLTVTPIYGDRSKGDQTRTVGAAQSIDVGESRSKSVSGNDTIVIGGSRKISCKGGHDLTVSKNRTLTAPVVLDVTLGTVTSTAKDGVMIVGGLALKASAQAISETVGKVSAQVVGGAKIEIAKRDRNLGVDKSLRELVGLKIDVQSGGVYSENAETTSKWTVGGEMKASSKLVVLEAKKQIRLKCGGNMLTITEDEITIEGTQLDLSGAKLETKTSTIEHNV